jgi:hypothetical protein
MLSRFSALPLLAALVACGPPKGGAPSPPGSTDSGAPDTGPAGGDGGDGGDTAGPDDSGAPATWDPASFGAEIVSYAPGEGAGFGQDQLPDIVLGPPQGLGEQGSLHVLSLGRGGEIVLAFDGLELVDGPGPDLLVFENPFPGWLETGAVAVSADGVDWRSFPCAADDAAGGFPGCSGVGFVWSHPDNGLDPTDPAVAGGDAFDLADLGLDRARFVRVTDSGQNTYDGVAGGYDLDAIAIVNGGPPEG